MTKTPNTFIYIIITLILKRKYMYYFYSELKCLKSKTRKNDKTSKFMYKTIHKLKIKFTDEQYLGRCLYKLHQSGNIINLQRKNLKDTKGKYKIEKFYKKNF